jgi:hypothetical protein
MIASRRLIVENVGRTIVRGDYCIYAAVIISVANGELPVTYSKLPFPLFCYSAYIWLVKSVTS